MGAVKILYNSIIEEGTLENQQAKYIKLMSVKAYKELYKDKIDAELIENGYKNIIVSISN